MKKGEVPVPYIVSLIIAAIVIGLIIFWFVGRGFIFNRTATEQECVAKKLLYCAEKPDNIFSSPCLAGGKIPDDVFAPDCCPYLWAHKTVATLCK